MSEDLQRRAEIAEGALDALVKQLGQISGAVIALRVNVLEDKASKDGARIGVLEKENRELKLRVEKLEKRIEEAGRMFRVLETKVDGGQPAAQPKPEARK